MTTLANTDSYCTVAQVKAALRIIDTTDDALLQGCVESASRLIDGHCARSFSNAGTATRYFAAESSYYIDVDDFQTSTITLETASSDYGVYDVTWTTGDYQLEPLNQRSDGQAWPYTRIRAVGDYLFPVDGGEIRVKLQAKYGWATVPKPVEQATIIQASRIFKRYDSPLGVAGFGEFGAMRVSSRLDPDVSMLVEPYRRMRQFV